MSDDTKVALITGATRGIGRAIALRLAKDGFCVVGTATTAAGAENISAYLAPFQGQGVVLNVTQLNDVETVLASITERLGAAPSVLVNNAAITRDNLALRMKNEEWQEVIDTNLNSVFYMTKACLKAMVKARFGRIVNITSIVAVSGNAGQINYAAAKAGMIGYTKSLAQEIASRHITVNAVAPGFIDTDMTRDLNEEHKQKLLSSIPMARLGSPDDIANAVAFLVSPQADYITGQTIHVNGGMLMA